MLAALVVMAHLGAVAICCQFTLAASMPPNGRVEAQADALLCLIAALDIDWAAVMGRSARPLEALQTAIRQPDRVSALIMMVPLGCKPR